MKRYQPKMQNIHTGKVQQQLAADPAVLFGEQEAAFDRQIEEVCDYLVEKNTTMVLLAGPSASGKTTTAKKICAGLVRRGKMADRVSLDNFYKSSDKLPYWRDGSRNYESIEGLDLDYFHDLLGCLWEKGRAFFPVFDFHHGKRKTDGFEVVYTPDTFLIFEGIHALNPRFFQVMNSHPCTGIYVSVHSDFVSDEGKVLLPARQLRLTRRILRDSVSRNTDAENTIAMWDKVLTGEKLYIWPHRMAADIHINSAHAFEPYLYHARITKALTGCPAGSPHSAAAKELLDLYSAFSPCEDRFLSPGSLIREFYK